MMLDEPMQQDEAAFYSGDDPSAPPAGFEFSKEFLEPQFHRGFSLGAGFKNPEGIDQYQELRLSEERLRWAKLKHTSMQMEKVSKALEAKTKVRDGQWAGAGDSGNAFANPDTGANEPVAAAIYALENYLPVMRGWNSYTGEKRRKKIFDRLKNGESVSDHEINLLTTQLALQENRKKMGLAAGALELAAGSAVFGVELLATRGLGSAAGIKALPETASLAQKARGWSALASAQALITGQASDQAARLRSRQSMSLEPIRDINGNYTLKYDPQEADPWWKAYPKGFVTAWTEGFSEQLGGLIPSTGIAKMFFKKYPAAGNSATTEFFKRMGINSFVGELAEERANEVMQFTLGTLTDKILDIGSEKRGQVTTSDLGVTGIIPKIPEMLADFYFRGENTPDVGDQSRQLLTEMLGMGGLTGSAGAVNLVAQRAEMKSEGIRAFQPREDNLLMKQWKDIAQPGTTNEEKLARVEDFLGKVKNGVPSRSDLDGTPFDPSEVDVEVNEAARKLIYESAKDAREALYKSVHGVGYIEDQLNKAKDKHITEQKKEVAEDVNEKIKDGEVESITKEVEEAEKRITEENLKDYSNKTPDEGGIDWIEPKEREEAAPIINPDAQTKNYDLKRKDKGYDPDRDMDFSDIAPLTEQEIKEREITEQEVAEREAADELYWKDVAAKYAKEKEQNKEYEEEKRRDQEAIRSEIGDSVKFKPATARQGRIKKRFKGINSEQAIELESSINEKWERDGAKIKTYNKEYRQLHAKAKKAFRSWQEKRNKDRVHRLKDPLPVITLERAIETGSLDSGSMKSIDEWGMAFLKNSTSFAQDLNDVPAWMEGQNVEEGSLNKTTVGEITSILMGGLKKQMTKADFEEQEFLDFEDKVGVETVDQYIDRKLKEKEQGEEFEDPFVLEMENSKGWFSSAASRLLKFSAIESSLGSNGKGKWKSVQEVKEFVLKTYKLIASDVLGKPDAIHFSNDKNKVSGAQFDVGKNEIWLNENFLVNASEARVRDALREEIIHGAMVAVMRKLNLKTSDFLMQIYNSMTKDQIDGIRSVYTTLTNKQKVHTAAEFTRAAIQSRLYGSISENSRNYKYKNGVLSRFLKKVYRYIQELFSGKKHTREHMEVMALSAKLVYESDPEARKDAFPLDQKTLADKAAESIYEKVLKDKGFDSRFRESDLWRAIKGTIPSYVDGQLNEQGLRDAMHEAIGKMIEANPKLLNPAKDFQAARVSNHALSWFLEKVPFLQKEGALFSTDLELRADISHAINVLAGVNLNDNVAVVNMGPLDYTGAIADMAGAKAEVRRFPTSGTDVLVARLENTTRAAKDGTPSGLKDFDQMVDVLSNGARAVAVMDAPSQSSKKFDEWMSGLVDRPEIEVRAHYVLSKELGGGGKKRILMVKKVDPKEKSKSLFGTKPESITGLNTDSLFQKMESSNLVDKIDERQATDIRLEREREAEAEQREYSDSDLDVVRDIQEDRRREGWVNDDGTVLVEGEAGGRMAEGYIAPDTKTKFQRRVADLFSKFRVFKHIPVKNAIASTKLFEKLSNKATGYQDDKESYDIAHEEFRQKQNDLPNAVANARRLIGRVIAGLSSSQMKLFSAYLVHQNAIRSYENFEGVQWHEDIGVLRAAHARLKEMVAEDTAVQEAFAKRADIVRSVIEKNIAVGVLNEDHWADFLEIDETGNPKYERFMHQEVMNVIGNSNVMMGRVKLSEKSPEGKEVRRNEKYDYNTHYIASEHAWLVTMELKAANTKFINKMSKHYGRKNQLEEKANLNNAIALVGGQENWDELQELRRQKAPQEMIDDLDPVGARRREMKNAAVRLNKLGFSMRQFGRNKVAQNRTMITLVQEIKAGDYSYFESEESPKINRTIAAAESWIEAYEEYQTLVKERLPKPDTWRTVFSREENTTSDDGRLWSETHKIFDPTQGNFHYSGLALQEYVSQHEVESLAEDPAAKAILEKYARDESKIEILPIPIVRQLEEFTEIGKQRLRGDMDWDNAVNRAFNWMKIPLLLGPQRAFGYTIRNLLGDTDAIIAANPGIVMKRNGVKVSLSDHMKEAFKEVYEYYKDPLSENLPTDILRATELGAVDQSYFDHEVSALDEVKQFEKYFKDAFTNDSAFKKPVTAVQQAFKKYFSAMSGVQQFREGVFRLAAYKYFKENADNDSIISATQRSFAKTIRDKLGVDEFAARMSRDTLIDYSNLTVVGSQLRKKLIPFWSFSEANLKRYMHMIDNAIVDLQESGDPTQLAKIGVLFTAKISALSLAALVFSRAAMAVFGIDDDDLGEGDKKGFNIILGKDPNGNVVMLRNVSALGDIMSWTGIAEAVQAYDNRDGTAENLSSMLEASSKNVVNKVVGMVHPFIKGPLETVVGMQSFPDVFNMRRNRRDDILADSLGLGDLWRETKGTLGFSGQSARSSTLYSSLFGRSYPTKLIGSTNPYVNAYHNAKGLYRSVMGKDDPSGGNVSPRPHFSVMKNAVFNKDRAAFDRAARYYIKHEGNIETFMRQMDNLKIYNLKERDDFISRLNAGEKELVNAAVGFLADSKQVMNIWFNETVDVDPEIRNEIVGSKLRTLSSNITGETLRDRKESREQKQRAFEWLRDNGVEYDEAERVVNRATSALKSTKARNGRRNQLRRMWREFSK